MKRFLSILLFLFFINATHAQQWEWAKDMGEGMGSKVRVDNFGNVYYLSTNLGSFNGTPMTCGNLQVMGALAKQDSNGNLIWVRGVPFYFSDLSIDKVGNLYVSGFFAGQTTICGGGNPNATVSAQNGADAILCKYNPSGDLIWTTTWDNNLSPDDDYADRSETDLDGNTYILGHSFYFSHPHDDPEIDNFILKIGPSGNVLWQKTNNWQDALAYTAIAVNNADIYLGGTIRYSGKFLGSFLISNMFSTVFFGKMDSLGNLLWSKIDGTGYDHLESISIDSHGNLNLTGNGTANSVFSGTTMTQNGMFLVQYDTSGSGKFIRNYTNALAGESAVDNDGNIFTTGKFTNGVSFSNGSSPPIILNTQKQGELFVIKHDRFGNLEWALAPTGLPGEPNYTYSIAHDNGKHCFLTGGYNTQTTFANTTLSGANTTGILLVKLKDTIASVVTGISENAQALNATLMPNPGSTQSSLLLSSFAQLHSYNVEILSTEGRKLYHYDGIDKPELTLDLTNFSSGLYFIRVIAKNATGESHTQTIKLIVS